MFSQLNSSESVQLLLSCLVEVFCLMEVGLFCFGGSVVTLYCREPAPTGIWKANLQNQASLHKFLQISYFLYNLISGDSALCTKMRALLLDLPFLPHIWLIFDTASGLFALEVYNTVQLMIAVIHCLALVSFIYHFSPLICTLVEHQLLLTKQLWGCYLNAIALQSTQPSLCKLHFRDYEHML